MIILLICIQCRKSEGSKYVGFFFEILKSLLFLKEVYEEIVGSKNVI